VEPVNDGTVDESGELSGSVSEGITDGREAKRHVQILSHSVEVELPAVVLVVNQTFSLHSTANVVNNTVEIFFSEQVRNLTR